MSDEKKSKNEDLTTSESISSNELAKFETDLKSFVLDCGFCCKTNCKIVLELALRLTFVLD